MFSKVNSTTALILNIQQIYTTYPLTPHITKPLHLKLLSTHLHAKLELRSPSIKKQVFCRGVCYIKFHEYLKRKNVHVHYFLAVETVSLG